MPRQAATTGSLPQAFERVKEMQAGGPKRGEGCRPLGRQAPAGIIKAGTSARPAPPSIADRRETTCPGAVASLRNDLDDRLACFRCRTLAGRRQVGTTNAIERRFREVRRRTRPTGTFRDRTSMDRIIHAVFIHEDRSRGIGTPLPTDT